MATNHPNHPHQKKKRIPENWCKRHLTSLVACHLIIKASQVFSWKKKMFSFEKCNFHGISQCFTVVFGMPLPQTVVLIWFNVFMQSVRVICGKPRHLKIRNYLFFFLGGGWGAKFKINLWTANFKGIETTLCTS